MEEVDLATPDRHRRDDRRDPVLQLTHHGTVWARVVDRRLPISERQLDRATPLDPQLTGAKVNGAVQVTAQAMRHGPALARAPEAQENILDQLLGVLRRQPANPAGELDQQRPIRPVQRLERLPVARANRGDQGLFFASHVTFLSAGRIPPDDPCARSWWVSVYSAR